jgi:hypothetical protein
MVLLALTVLTPLVSPAALQQQQQQLPAGSYIVPLEMRQGAVRTRSGSSSSSRQLLGAGKVQVMGRWVLMLLWCCGVEGSGPLYTSTWHVTAVTMCLTTERDSLMCQQLGCFCIVWGSDGGRVSTVHSEQHKHGEACSTRNRMGK